MKKQQTKKVGITGQSGFVGSYLKNYIQFIVPEGLEIIEFKDNYFKNEKKLQRFVSECDSIVHLAAMSRGDEDEVYTTNINLTKKLINALDKSGARPQVIFASSIHEETNNSFGRSKKDSRVMLEKWAKKNHTKFTGLVIPHIFGPFAKPFHNSALATFCHQLATHSLPKVVNDSELKLIYVEHLVAEIIQIITSGVGPAKVKILPDKKMKVSDLIKKLKYFNTLYLKNNIIPELKIEFDINLFNTLRSYVNDDDRKISLIKKKDPRGYFCEMTKSENGGQFSFSSTNPAVERGNHFHKSKIERFCVIEGKAIIKIRKIGQEKIHSFLVSGGRPVIIDIPIWYAHNIKNISSKPLVTLFFANEIFDPNCPDTYSEQV